MTNQDDLPPDSERWKDRAMPQFLTDLPEALIQGQIMPFLGPKDVLISLGSTARSFRTLATSDVVWKEFCAHHGTKQSKVYQKMMEICENDDPKLLESDKMKSVQARFLAFEKASKETNALEQYKRLRRRYLRTCQSLNPECRDCHQEGTSGQWRIITVCAEPKCDVVRCLWHHKSGVISCDWCRIQVCSAHSFKGNLLETCHSCHKTACLDCRLGILKMGFCKNYRCNSCPKRTVSAKAAVHTNANTAAYATCNSDSDSVSHDRNTRKRSLEQISRTHSRGPHRRTLRHQTHSLWSGVESLSRELLENHEQEGTRMAASIVAWLDEKWMPQEVHVRMAESAKQSYMACREKGDTDRNSIMMHISRDLEANWSEVDAWDVSNCVSYYLNTAIWK